MGGMGASSGGFFVAPPVSHLRRKGKVGLHPIVSQLGCRLLAESGPAASGGINWKAEITDQTEVG